MGKSRIAVRQNGNEVTTYLTSAGSVAQGKRLAQHPKAKAAQNCIKQAAGDKTKASKCLAGI